MLFILEYSHKYQLKIEMMRKIKIIELEVDFIGGEGSLTIEEEKSLSDFFKQQKLTLANPEIKKSVRKAKQKNTAK
ncbi:hypothetical protein [Flavobacterium gawalongense]|uniref:Uncharacterized protein n=1 Tax=Flavobacterium gawalongense TaxID=2594432 RepID=A0A553BYS3_9FLAO|nr:hypothetical protein [Flavobacterium gawalongense]TRX04535.1 hypothetical protein FNW33_00515 [Flavobacterium gawalongense]TRX10422.1 hypothetical protein FNW12_00500 [Flavobacterium gawalongense]TRX13470.1 hypothetical protein FNW11_01015 [Flavobacterium gawalongense]TRX15598.1 hypothetical protein FNW10_00675 [Flavobacterium gawalongense]TRX31436.1 hypothetical protein FNW38_00675 [Flavobacterium gawalongense]